MAGRYSSEECQIEALEDFCSMSFPVDFWTLIIEIVKPVLPSKYTSII